VGRSSYNAAVISQLICARRLLLTFATLSPRNIGFVAAPIFVGGEVGKRRNLYV
jgi:hypothetical protein